MTKNTVDAGTAELRPKRGAKLLVIEDRDVYRDAIKAHLQEQGFRVTAVSYHSQAAREDLRKYAAIITDAETDTVCKTNRFAVHGTNDGAEFIRYKRDEMQGRTVLISAVDTWNQEMLNALDDPHAPIVNKYGAQDKTGEALKQFLAELDDALESIKVQPLSSSRENKGNSL